MYLIPKGIGEQSAESVLGVSYSECAGSWAEAGMEEARVQCLNLSFWKWIYTSRMLLLFSHPIISNSLQLHGLQHARPPHPYCLPRFAHVHVHWYHAAISSSDTLFSFCPQSFPASGTFPLNWLFSSVDQNTGASPSASVLPMTIQGLFLMGLISLLSKGLSGVLSSTTVQRHQLFGTLPSLRFSSHNYQWPQGRP